VLEFVEVVFEGEAEALAREAQQRCDREAGGEDPRVSTGQATGARALLGRRCDIRFHPARHRRHPISQRQLYTVLGLLVAFACGDGAPTRAVANPHDPERVATLVEAASNTRAPLLFVGDSITELWSE
jgi:hypothetical protein